MTGLVSVATESGCAAPPRGVQVRRSPELPAVLAFAFAFAFALRHRRYGS
ncbi:hypothetical protein IFT79_01915 [Frigoribacterium sp. CFBP 8759]|nr:hypothetical protein [Frigoribacterium sp. CFBP 8759]MBD8484365.1 hypothetical protein [Frigoribacterium sp. CFBP 8759]